MLFYNVNLDVLSFTANVEASEVPLSLLESFGLTKDAFAQIEADGTVSFDDSVTSPPTIEAVYLTFGNLTVMLPRMPLDQLREELYQQWVDQGGPYQQFYP